MNSIMLIIKHVFSLTSFFGYCTTSGGKGEKEPILKTSFTELISMIVEYTVVQLVEALCYK